VSYEQLIALGLSVKAIQYRVAIGRLHRIHQGVYAVGHAALTWRGRTMAGVLALGAGAVASHRTAAALWQIHASNRYAIDVTTPARGRKRRDGVSLHRVRSLHPSDYAIRDDIPVTSVARTLIDFAELAPLRHLERAFEEADRRRLLDMRAVDAVMGRSRGRHGLKALGKVVAAYRGEGPMTRSEMERLFLELCRQAGLPMPVVNMWVAGYEVDMLWPNARLVVELDSREFHLNPAAFERDRERDATLQVLGYRVVRFTYRMLIENPAEVVARLRALLAVAA
jgi:very-short-patch-repair endonuclease